MRDLDGVSLVYFVQAGEDGPIAIGSTSRIGLRMAELQAFAHAPLSLRGFVRGGNIEELAIRQRFEHLLLRAEWFEADRDLLRFIDEKCEHVVAPVERAEPLRLPRPRGLSLALGFMRAVFGGKRVAR